MPEQPSYPNHEEKGKPKFKSEFSMGMFDFQRFHDMLRYTDYYAFQVARGQYNHMKELFALLNTLYANWQSILFKSNKVREIDKLFEDLQKDIAKSEKIMSQTKSYSSPVPNRFITKTSNKLLKLHRRVMELKQWVGLGIQVKTEIGKRKMIKLGMRGVDVPKQRIQGDDSES